MIVEALVPDPRRRGSTRVIVNGRPAWTVPADVIASLALEPGQTLRGEVVERLDRAADEEGAFRSGLRALERRSHASRELGHKLERKGHPRPAIDAALARLTELGLLDDVAFANHYVMARTERGRGPIRLRRDLALLGVPRDVADMALGQLLSETIDPLERPRELVARRARQLAALPVDTKRRRLVAFLARRGYRGSDAFALVQGVLRAEAAGPG